jgi:hypothetical protein
MAGPPGELNLTSQRKLSTPASTGLLLKPVMWGDVEAEVVDSSAPVPRFGPGAAVATGDVFASATAPLVPVGPGAAIPTGDFARHVPREPARHLEVSMPVNFKTVQAKAAGISGRRIAHGRGRRPSTRRRVAAAPSRGSPGRTGRRSSSHLAAGVAR